MTYPEKAPRGLLGRSVRPLPSFHRKSNRARAFSLFPKPSPRGSLLHLHARFARDHFADHEGRNAQLLELPLNALGEVAADDNDETDAVVENGVHLALFD